MAIESLVRGTHIVKDMYRKVASGTYERYFNMVASPGFISGMSQNSLSLALYNYVIVDTLTPKAVKLASILKRK